MRRVFEALGERMHFKGMEAIGFSVPEAAGFFGAQDFRIGIPGMLLQVVGGYWVIRKI